MHLALWHPSLVVSNQQVPPFDGLFGTSSTSDSDAGLFLACVWCLYLVGPRIGSLSLLFSLCLCFWAGGVGWVSWISPSSSSSDSGAEFCFLVWCSFLGVAWVTSWVLYVLGLCCFVVGVVLLGGGVEQLWS